MAVVTKIKKNSELKLKKKVKTKSDSAIGYTFMLPALLSLLIFVFGPIFFSFLLSLYENPIVDELRHATEYFTDLNNTSLASLYRLFVINDPEFNLLGILIPEGLKLLIIAIMILIYMRKIYKKLEKNPQNSSLKSWSNSIGMSIIPGIFFFVLFQFLIPDIPIIGLIIGVISFGISLFFFKRYFSKKEKINRFISAITAIIISLIAAPLILSLITLFFELVTFISVIIKLPLDEYRYVLTDVVQLDFLRILFNTVFWTLTCTLLHVIFGMLLAILMNRNFVGKGFFRGIFILPWAIPSFVSTLIWRNFIFDFRQGFLGTRTRDIFGGTLFSYSYISETDGLTHLGWSFTLGDLFVLILTIILVVFIVINISKFFEKKLKLNPKFKPFLVLIAMLIFIPLALQFFNFMAGSLRNLNFLTLNVVDLPDITSTFWITDDVYLFGNNTFKIKMVTFSAILMNVWLGVPFMMVSFLAALQSIPPDLYEAAEIDGASGWQQFKKITFPLLKPTLFTVSLLGFIWTFNLFNVFYLLTENQTGIGDAKYYSIFVTYIYRLFDVDKQFSQAAAMSFIVFLMLITFSKVYNKIVDIDKMFTGEEEDKGEKKEKRKKRKKQKKREKREKRKPSKKNKMSSIGSV
jgi:ABC-type sugar transport system permease subunit